MLASEDYYFNDEGLMVFTRAYHLKRGYCCGNGCKHCPYPLPSDPDADSKPQSGTNGTPENGE